MVSTMIGGLMLVRITNLDAPGPCKNNVKRRLHLLKSGLFAQGGLWFLVVLLVSKLSWNICVVILEI